MNKAEFQGNDFGQWAKVNEEALSDLKKHGAPEEVIAAVRQQMNRRGCLENMTKGALSKERSKIRPCAFVKGEH